MEKLNWIIKHIQFNPVLNPEEAEPPESSQQPNQSTSQQSYQQPTTSCTTQWRLCYSANAWSEHQHSIGFWGNWVLKQGEWIVGNSRQTIHSVFLKMGQIPKPTLKPLSETKRLSPDCPCKDRLATCACMYSRFEIYYINLKSSIIKGFPGRYRLQINFHQI